MNITPIPQAAPARGGHHQPVRRAGHGAGAGGGARSVVQPRADLRQFLRRRYGGLRQLPGGRSGLHARSPACSRAWPRRNACCTRRNTPGRRTSRWWSTRWPPAMKARRRRCRTPGRWPGRTHPTARCSSAPARCWWKAIEALVETASFFAKAPPPKAKGAAIVAASGGAAIMAADRAEQHGVPLPQPGRGAARPAGVAHSGFRRGAQSVRRDRPDSERSGIAERLRRRRSWPIRNTPRWWCR